MLKLALIIAFVMFISVAFAQLDSNSVTVTASRGVNLQPDQTVFSVSVDSSLNTGLDDVLTALQGTGIAAGNFSGVSNVGSNQQGQPQIQWYFVLPVPVSKMKDTVTALTNLQQTITQKNNALSLSFNIQGSQVSLQLQQSQTCPLTDLLADARAQAQKLASATALGAGTILAMSSSISTTVPNGVSDYRITF